jgi:thiol-disulfide isomerase/thioredoxin
MVKRLSKEALQKILAGKTKGSASIAIKFYSNNCHYCHALKSAYEDVQKEYEDILFFAFNIEDHPGLGKILNFQGVPTICTIKIDSGRHRIRVMPDPEKPNGDTWYNISDVKAFIGQI